MVNFIFENQSYLRLKLWVNNDISAGTTFKIAYIRPDSSTGELVAILEGTEYIYYDLTNNAGVSEINMNGIWKFYPIVTFADGRILPGKSKKVYIYVKGS